MKLNKAGKTQIFVKVANTKCHQNPFSENRVFVVGEPSASQLQRETNMTKLIVTSFLAIVFTKVPNNERISTVRVDGC